jgi:peptide/nickel transport system permease protein
MTTYISRRLIQSLLVVILITFLVFMVIRLLPGDPILMYLTAADAQTMTSAQIEADPIR